MAITKSQQARQMLKNGTKPVVQGGVDNYLGKQPQVVAPRKWQSGPDKPPTELAYITEAEKKLLLKEDIHGSLKKGPNQGPAGIMSLDSFGDIGGAGAAGGDTEAGGGAMEGRGFSGRGPSETKSDFDNRVRNQKEIFQAAERRQARDLGIRERKNVIDMRRPGRFSKFGLSFNPLSTLLGFINPFLGLATRGIMSIPDIGRKFKSSNTLADFFSKVRGPKGITTDDDDTTLLDQVDPNLPFAQSYLKQLQNKMPPKITIDDDMSLTPDMGLKTAPGDSLDTPFQQDIKQDNFLDNAMAGLTKKQQQMLAGPQKNLKNIMGISDEEILQNISPFNDPNDPATLEEVRNFYTAADGGMIGGGIMDAAGRQNYFLGKLVKKAKRAVKKIVKSPVGKIGLGALALKFGLPDSAKSGIMDFLFKKGTIGSGLTGKGMLALGAGLSAAPLLFQQEEEQGEGLGTTGSVGGQIDPRAYTDPYGVLFSAFKAEGGSMKDEPVAKRTMPLLDMGGQEMDLRAEGGFVPIGKMEKADDVPARLSKNEFVFTADAVRNAGDGDVDKGAEVMYNMMKNLESGGDVSEESQGLEGARQMFQTSKRLEEVI
jgi:hypothetical protein